MKNLFKILQKYLNINRSKEEKETNIVEEHITSNFEYHTKNIIDKVNARLSTKSEVKEEDINTAYAISIVEIIMILYSKGNKKASFNNSNLTVSINDNTIITSFNFKIDTMWLYNALFNKCKFLQQYGTFFNGIQINDFNTGEEIETKTFETSSTSQNSFELTEENTQLLKNLLAQRKKQSDFAYVSSLSGDLPF